MLEFWKLKMIRVQNGMKDVKPLIWDNVFRIITTDAEIMRCNGYTGFLTNYTIDLEIVIEHDPQMHTCHNFYGI